MIFSLYAGMKPPISTKVTVKQPSMILNLGATHKLKALF